ncbi:MAG TPA: retropepsin-like aspartic protease [Lentimicrobium sp.]|nr:retropepsin-like aspartic protease [Lentimicrobium sp.]
MTSLKLIQLNFETGGYNLLARVIINGKPALLMVDTGSPKTVLDTDHLQKFVNQTELKRNPRRGLAGITSVYTYIATIEKLEIGSIVINDYKAAAVDLGQINRSFRGMGNPQIDGLLGCDLLRHCKAVLRFEDRLLELNALEEPDGSVKNEIIE